MKKVAVITGGAVNIGAAITIKMALNGFKIAIVYNSSAKKADEIVEKIIKNGGYAASFKADVSSQVDVEELFKAIAKDQELGRVDALINNSGIFTLRLQEDLSVTEWRKLFDINVTGNFLCCREAVKLMKVQPLLEGSKTRGCIINIASINALHPGFGQTAHYDGSKGAVFSYTKSLAAELGSFGIRVNSVSPGLVESKGLRRHSSSLAHIVEKRNPLKNATGGHQLVNADEVANAVLFLASEMSNAITGENIVVDCGYLLS